MAMIAADPLAVAPGIARWLVELEASARHFAEQSIQRLERPRGLAILRESAGRLGGFLNDTGPSSLAIFLLQRPLAEFKLGTPRQSLLARLGECLLEDAKLALKLQADVDVLFDKVGSTREQFKDAPNVTNRLMVEAELADEALIDIRSAAEIERAWRRLNWVRQQLSDVKNDFGDTAHGLDSVTEPVDELLVRYRQRVRERRAIAWRLGLWGRVRSLMVRQYQALRRIGTAVRLRSPVAHVVEETLRPGLHSRTSIRRYEAGIHGVLLGLASEASCDAITRLIARSRNDAPVDLASDKRYVLPITDEYAIVSSSIRSSIRAVRESPIEPGRDGQVVLDPEDGWELLDIAALDLRPLYDGLRLDSAGIYDVAEEPTLEMLGDLGAGTLSRIRKRGRVAPVQFSGTEQHPARIRILRAPSPDVEISPPEIQRIGEGLPAFLGFETTIVHALVAGCEAAWFRTSENLSAARRRSLALEAELFAQLGGASASDGQQGSTPLAMPPMLGAGRVFSDRGLTGVLYLPPDAVTLAAGPAMRTWLLSSEAHRLDAVRAVARMSRAIRNCGFCLGVYHVDAIAFGFQWSNEGLRPAATPVYAPMATRLGEPFPAVPRRSVEQLEYSNLRFRGLGPGADSTAPENGLVDDIAFAIFALDFLSAGPLGDTNRWDSAGRMAQAIAKAPAEQWHSPELARELASSLLVALAELQGGSDASPVLEAAIHALL